MLLLRNPPWGYSMSTTFLVYKNHPQITQHQLCIVDFLPPVKELLWSWNFLKCPAVVAFAASTYTVNNNNTAYYH